MATPAMAPAARHRTAKSCGVKQLSAGTAPVPMPARLATGGRLATGDWRLATGDGVGAPHIRRQRTSDASAMPQNADWPRQQTADGPVGDLIAARPEQDSKTARQQDGRTARQQDNPDSKTTQIAGRPDSRNPRTAARSACFSTALWEGRRACRTTKPGQAPPIVEMLRCSLRGAAPKQLGSAYCVAERSHVGQIKSPSASLAIRTPTEQEQCWGWPGGGGGREIWGDSARG